MKITVSEKDLECPDDAALIWTCIAPVILNIRGRNKDVKSEAYDGLTPGQQALMMFQVIYGHSKNGIEELYSIIPYMPSGKGIWQEFRKSMQYFGDSSMHRLLGEMEKDYETRTAVSVHNAAFREAIQKTVALIGSYIRSKPEEFVDIDCSCQ